MWTQNDVEWVAKEITSLNQPDDLEELARTCSEHRVVLMGEASHGTQEYYHWRRLLSQKLIEDYGFKFIAVEGDWPACQHLHDYIFSDKYPSAEKALRELHRWPTWMWANDEVRKLGEWLKNRRIGFYGLDLYSLFESMHEVIRYVRGVNPELARRMEQRYACFDPFYEDEIAYAKSLLRLPQGCAENVVANLQDLLTIKIKDDSHQLFSAAENARLVIDAESYYRSMLFMDVNSWNVRDTHMMNCLSRILEYYGEGAKGIVWAHNTHVGDYRQTDMIDEGYVNLGGLARERLGEDNVYIVGFGSYQGSVLAAHAWDAPEEVMSLPRGMMGSYEDLFHQVCEHEGIGEFILPLKPIRFEADLHLGRRGHRAVGVVYDPRRERPSQYVPTRLAWRYDAFIFSDHSHALYPLKTRWTYGEVPGTWPRGQ